MKKIISLVLVLVMLFSLAGCSGNVKKDTASNNKGADTNADSASESSAAESNGGSGEKAPYSGTISIACGPLEAAALSEVLPEYQKKNPDVKLDTIITQTVTDFETMMTSWIASGTLPDMYIAQGGATEQGYAKSGYLLPLTDAGIKDRLVDGDLELFTYNNDLYAFPMALSVSAVIVNKGALAKAGVDLNENNYPKNWQEFLSLLDKCVAAGIKKPLGISGKDTSEVTAWTFQYMYQAIYGKNPNWYADVLRDKAAWNDDLYLEMFDKYAQMRPYIPDDALGTDSDGMRKSFITGETPFIFQTAMVVGNIKALDPEVEIMVLPSCFTDDEKDQTLISGFDCGVSITKDAKNKELCFDFLDFLASEQGATIFNESTGYLPTTRDNDAKLDPAYDLIYEILDNNKLPNSPILSRQWIAGIKEIVKAGQQDWFAGTDAKSVADKIQEEHQRLVQADPDWVNEFLANYKDR
ncbi:ABC transporter substrate-binding protein [Lacrimispora sp.]|uniref:ABC transporter substrate-binding protein n=1 Tax=Lacrimispora sp. TaxID=2719234 RepID=UPI0028A0FD38|nr:extracellular solute-binding protein [Lacrimispora sp.]